MLWDIFLSHASEDKDTFARPLARELEAAGLRVWFDESQVALGRGLREQIERGLSNSSFGVIVVSPAFLTKYWTDHELKALLAREDYRDTLLPVWHGISELQVAEFSPDLAQIAAVPSSNLSQVVRKISEVAAPFLRRPDGGAGRRYSSSLDIPIELIRRAADAIEVLAQPATWPSMAITAKGYPAAGWMGANSRTLVDLLHGFAGPLFAYRALDYEAARNVALIDRRSRLIIGLLHAAVELFTDEILIASSAPRIQYAPRVPDWRSKRQTDPARYWWQGLSRYRFDELRCLFLRASSVESTANFVSALEFQDNYEKLYSGEYTDRKQQQLMGLFANGFYGFVPRNRPVLWRALACQARLYQAILACADLDFAGVDSLSSDVLFCGGREAGFPYQVARLSSEDLQEPFEITFAATTNYIETFVMPRLQAICGSTAEE